MSAPQADDQFDDPYSALALVYDDWQARYGTFSDGVLERLVPLLDSIVPPLESFVEAGCGTGTLLSRLTTVRPRWRLAGADPSAPMLAQARRKPARSPIAWHQLPLGAPLPGAPYDAAGCFFNTLNHLADVPALLGALLSLSAALRPGGMLAFDVNNHAGYTRWWRGHDVYEGPDWRMESDARYDESLREAQATIAIWRGGRTAEVKVREHLFTDAEIENALRAAGLLPVSAELWSPTPDGVAGSTFWVARRVSRQEEFRA